MHNLHYKSHSFHGNDNCFDCIQNNPEKIKELCVSLRNSSFSLHVLRNQCQCLENRSYHIVEVACTVLRLPTLWLLPSIQDYLADLRPLGLLLNSVFIL